MPTSRSAVIEIREDREAAIRAGFPALDLDISYEQFEKAMQEYELAELSYRGHPIGMLALRGPEIHLALQKKYRLLLTRPEIKKELLEPVLKAYGYALAAALKEDKGSQGFLDRLGFTAVDQKDGIILYRRNA